MGSTGSIGTQTLEVIDSSDGEFEVVALAVSSSADTAVAQAERYRPKVVVVADESKAVGVAERLPPGVDLLVGNDSLADVCETADVVVNGVVGFAGLGVTLRTLELGRRLALANKESLIAAGPLVQRARRTPGAELLPVDSEHCAIHQCLASLRRGNGDGEDGGDDRTGLSRIVLTASGGPFRGRTLEDLADVTVDEALAHPTWKMGPKITIDSSTLMNKGLEVIEAHELFGVGYDDIDVVVHPQSIAHSMAEFTDGSSIVQVSMPDMRLPIAYCLAYPERFSSAFGRMDWTVAHRLEFEPPDRETFKCLDLAYGAGRMGETAPAWLSAANEVVVEYFLHGRLRWPQIAEVLDRALSQWDGTLAQTVDDVLHADQRARQLAAQAMSRL
jgi:1-deoxy-D-xylulose-5-phosphate reductoisomerase